MRGPVNQVFRFLVWITTGIRPRQWVAVHRKHHAFTDVEGDPHSPVLLGWWNVQRRNVALYRAEARNPETLARYAKDIPETRRDRVLYDHGLLGLAVGIDDPVPGRSVRSPVCWPRSSTSTCCSARTPR